MARFNRNVGIAAPTTSMGLPTFAGVGGQSPAAVQAKGIAAAPVPFQETWVEKRDREAAEQKAAGIQSTPFQETWVEKRDREAAQQPAPVAGLAKGGIAGLIPGKINPKVADDVNINAKIGEYMMPQEVVSYLGVKKLDELVEKVRKEIGWPQGTGPKSSGEPDGIGRHDKPGLHGIAGLAYGGIVDLENEDPMQVGAGQVSIQTARPSAQAGETTKQFDLAGNEMTDETAGNSSAVNTQLTRNVAENMGIYLPADRSIASPPMSARDRIIAKDAQIMNTKTVPTQAGITQNMVQRPSFTAKTAIRSIAGSDVPGTDTLPLDNMNGKYARGTYGIDKGSSGPTLYGSSAVPLTDAQRAQQATDTDARESYAANIEAQKSKARVDKDRQSRIDLLNQIISQGLTNQYDGPQQVAAAKQELATITGQQQLGQSADKIANERYQADQTLAGQKAVAGAHIAAAKINHENDLAKAQAHTQATQAAEAQKDYKELSNKYFDHFSKLNLPTDVSGRIAEISKDYAMAADPSNPLGLYFEKGSRRAGFMADKRLVQAGLDRAARNGYNLEDPAQYNKALNDIYMGLRQKKDVPNMYAFVDKSTADKQAQNALPPQ